MCAAPILSSDAADLVRTTARAALADPGPLLTAADEAVLEPTSPLAAHPELAAQARASTHANVTRWLTSNEQRPGARVGHDVAPEALEIARDLFRRGFDREVLATAYRHGQNVAWRYWMAGLTEQAATTPAWSAALAEALDATASSLFAFVDDIIINVAERIERERDQLIGDSLALRLETVRLILEEAPISEPRAAERLGYELADHVAMVLWTTDSASAQGPLEGVATRLATAGGLRSPFMVPAGLTSLWGWAAAPGAPDVDAMRAALDAAPSTVHAALGSVAPGIRGFRESHHEALAVQRLISRRDGARLTSYEEVDAVVLAGADAERSTRFVRATLGPLLDERPELRETLRVYLQEHRSATHAARRLFTHRNTVLNRVARAEALLPRPDHGLGVSLALELDYWLTRPT